MGTSKSPSGLCREGSLEASRLRHLMFEREGFILINTLLMQYSATHADHIPTLPDVSGYKREHSV